MALSLPSAERWDLLTMSKRSGELRNLIIAARPGELPTASRLRAADAEHLVLSQVRGDMRDYGVASLDRHPELQDWVVIIGTTVFPLVEIPMLATRSDGHRLPIEFVGQVVFDGEGAFPGAAQTMATIHGPFESAPAPPELTAPGQCVVEQNLETSPRWLENEYLHDGIVWRQRNYWSVRDRYIVQYQAPAERSKEVARLREVAEVLARHVRQLR